MTDVMPERLVDLDTLAEEVAPVVPAPPSGS